jgi:hypothetical protein
LCGPGLEADQDLLRRKTQTQDLKCAVEHLRSNISGRSDEDNPDRSGEGRSLPDPVSHPSATHRRRRAPTSGEKWRGDDPLLRERTVENIEIGRYWRPRRFARAEFDNDNPAEACKECL